MMMTLESLYAALAVVVFAAIIVGLFKLGALAIRSHRQWRTDREQREQLDVDTRWPMPGPYERRGGYKVLNFRNKRPPKTPFNIE